MFTILTKGWFGIVRNEAGQTGWTKAGQTGSQTERSSNLQLPLLMATDLNMSISFIPDKMTVQSHIVYCLIEMAI